MICCLGFALKYSNRKKRLEWGFWEKKWQWVQGNPDGY